MKIINFEKTWKNSKICEESLKVSGKISRKNSKIISKELPNILENLKKIPEKIW